MLDLNTDWYAEVRWQLEKKVACGEIYLLLFVVSPTSPNARKYDFKVCKRYREEKKKLSDALAKILKLNEVWYIKMYLCIWDLLIAWRS